MYRHCPPPTKPIGLPQTSTAGVRHGGWQWFSSTEFRRYGCRKGFWISMNIELNRFAYIYTKLEISTPFKSDLRFPSPFTKQKPTTVSASCLQATFAFAATVPPKSNLQGIVFASIAWWLIRLCRWVNQWLFPRIFSFFGF